MNRQEIIELAESVGLLYPEPKSSSDYNSPAHMRLISKLEKFYNSAFSAFSQGCSTDEQSANTEDFTPTDSQ